MFDNLTKRLGGIFDTLRGKKQLTEEAVGEALREIRVALLEADVALPVVKEFVEKVKPQATGQELIKGVNPAQQVVKIVHDALVEMLGADDTALNLNAAPPRVVLMAGLQGSGKTTTTGKISKFLSAKHSQKVLMASLDVQRPAAQEQLKQLGEQNEIATLEIVKGQSPVDITKRALKEAKLGGYDVLMLDTAGRLAIDDALMDELAQVKKVASPLETLLVVDCLMGQDALNVATQFKDRIGITGIVLTRVDGDARGGAALSMRAVTGCPIKFLGTGEKADALEMFHAERLAGRILDMGDVVSLVERAAETIDEEQAKKMAEKFQQGKFDLNDMLVQFTQMENMGGLGSMMKMLPGLGRVSDQIDSSKLENGMLKKQKAMIQSMTPQERANPNILSTSRKRRIASGSATTVQDINRLLKQHETMEKMMKRMKKMGMGGMAGMMKNLMGGTDAKLLEEAATAEGLDMSQFASGNGFPNLLQGGGQLPAGFPDLLGGKKKR
ncbi:MAG: signal recognition particle protein [Alphaproteobacteria bacterium]|nr:signal recognition particle protein [Alphaproteobacteria bacterium]